MGTHRTFLAAILFLCIFAAFPARAEDPPLPRVGQVSLAEGAVAIRPAGGEWADSALNEPVPAGTSVRSSAHGRAVLRVGADTIALAPGSELDLARLDSEGTQLVLRRGRIAIRRSALGPPRGWEIDLIQGPSQGGVWFSAAGDYDIAAGDEHTAGRLAVLDGEARVVAKDLDTMVTLGSALALKGGGDPLVTKVDAAADEFSRWWLSAQHDERNSLTLRHVAAETTGWQELDANGRWQDVAGYGAVWFPDPAAEKRAAGGGNWAPYRYGHWRWTQPWGWSWIDNANWAFAPLHYGRWARFPIAQREPNDAVLLSAGPAERWGWIPGNPAVPPAYMPAAVAFLGTAGVGLSYPDAFGPAVAWFPLAPGEVYWPGYASEPGMIRRINAASVRQTAVIEPGPNGEPPADIVNAEYQNRRFASVVPRTVFLAGRPVAPALLELPARRLDNAPLLAGSPQIAPGARAIAVANAAPAISQATTGQAANGQAKLAAAAQALSQILAPRGAATPVHSAGVHSPEHTAAPRSSVLVRAETWRRAAAALVAHAPPAATRSARPHLVSIATAARSTRPRLHLAAIHRR